MDSSASVRWRLPRCVRCWGPRVRQAWLVKEGQWRGWLCPPQLVEPLNPPPRSHPPQLLSVDNLEGAFDLSEAFSAPQLAKRCVLFALERYDDLLARHGGDGYAALMGRMVSRATPLRAVGLPQSMLQGLQPFVKGAAAHAFSLPAAC